MNSGPFIWKPGYFTPPTRVEISDEKIDIDANGRRRRIDPDEIASVYVLRWFAIPVSHILDVAIVLKSGESARLSVSRYGWPGSAAEECKRATIAILSRLQAANPAAEICRGVRPTSAFKLSMAAAFCVAYLFAALMIWRDGDPADWRFTASILGMLFILLGAFYFLQTRDSALARKISADDAIAYLD